MQAISFGRKKLNVLNCIAAIIVPCVALLYSWTINELLPMRRSWSFVTTDYWGLIVGFRIFLSWEQCKMTTLKDFNLDNIDPEDFGDTLLKLEKSFGTKFADNSFKIAKTFGDICNIIESQINIADKDDCTTQQAFYKVRKAIVLTQNWAERNIEPQTKLEAIFPRTKRRQNVKLFQQALGFSVDILSMKTWLALTIAASFIVSLIAFFFSWQYTVADLTFFTLVTWAANKFSKELNLSTVRDLTEKISREHYSLVRRQSGTMNRNEIAKTIQDVFIADHLIERKHLTKDASLGWS